jgi:hypothetical protein
MSYGIYGGFSLGFSGRVFFVSYGVLGLPFEAVMDTLLLPIDLTYHEPQKAGQ